MLRSPTLRISFGLTLLTVSILLFSDMLGLIPNQRDVVLNARKILCESLAVQLSVAAGSGHFESVEKSMQAIVTRNDDVLSLRLRTSDDRVLAEAGDHAPWQRVSGDKSVPNQVAVPIFRGTDRWGAVEVRFDTISGHGPLGLPGGGNAELCLFFVVSGFGLFFIFIKKTLRHLDPSAVIPGRVKATLDALSEGVLLMDKQQRIVLANAKFSEIADEDCEDLVGRSASELAWVLSGPGESRPELPWERVLSDGVSKRGVIMPVLGPAGGLRRFSVNGAPILDQNGVVRGALATFDDVTEIEKKNDELEKLVSLLKVARDQVNQKNRELEATNQIIEAKVTERTAELRESMEAAKAADRAKSAFLANISHELRTPMHAILSFSEFGMKKSDTAERGKLMRYFEHVHTSGHSLLSLLNNLLDLSKVQANKMEFHLRRLPLRVLAAHVVSEFSVMAESRGVDLVCLDPGFDTNADLDGDRITQVLRNLVSNAIKFTEKGGRIEVGMRKAVVSVDGDAVPGLEAWVADQGVGIPEDQLQDIFDPFTQSSRTDSGSGGTGLGLAISKEIVNAHGGWIRASNRPEGGALFEFSLPFEAVLASA